MLKIWSQAKFSLKIFMHLRRVPVVFSLGTFVSPAVPWEWEHFPIETHASTK